MRVDARGDSRCESPGHLRDSPDPRQGPESPFPGKEGFGAPAKTPISPRSGKGSFLSKIPPLCKGTHGRWGFWDRNLHFPAFVGATGNGGFGPRNPLFQEVGIRAPSWGFVGDFGFVGFFFFGGGGWARETGAICQLGVLTRKRCIF